VQQGYDDLSGSEVDHESSDLLRIAFPDSHALLRNQNCSSLLELTLIPQMLPLVAKRASLPCTVLSGRLNFVKILKGTNQIIMLELTNGDI
jgi:hypothetical protein